MQYWLIQMVVVSWSVCRYSPDDVHILQQCVACVTSEVTRMYILSSADVVGPHAALYMHMLDYMLDSRFSE